MFRTLLTSSVLAAGLVTSAFAAAEKYTLDASHSQVLFSYDHLGFSTTYGMFSGFEGEIMFDADAPASSSVNVSMPVMSMFTGWEAREGHFMSDDFFGAKEGDLVTFTSTAIEVTGDDTAKITGDLTMNEVTKSVVLNAVLNKAAAHPFANKPWLGFDATTTLLRSDFGVGNFAPAVSDAVEVKISIEAQKAE
ncbi:YceI family protein [Nereida sp. NH-UV-3]|uniref:YceI family protein n=1 Tax=Nereida TaxID=282198 RepID=UPI0036F31863